MNLLSLTYDELVNEFRCRYGRGPYHAEALYRRFYHHADADPRHLPEFARSPDLARAVARDLDSSRPRLAGQTGQDDVVKLVFSLADGNDIETVIIPAAGRVTVCVSCQVGCRMGCRFCETGRMGLLRPLTTAEIVYQVYAINVLMGRRVRNVVFMGMGEPLDNFEQVTQAVRVLSDQRGLNIAMRHITLSTAGLADGIDRLAALGWPQLRLAISLNAPNDALRTAIMPVNKQFPLARLMGSLRDYPLSRGGCLFLEYVLIGGVNDRPAHAAELAGLIRVLGVPAKINLIACNPRRCSPFKAPTAEAFEAFHRILVGEKVFVRVRREKGAAIRAACGQLGGAARLGGAASLPEQIYRSDGF